MYLEGFPFWNFYQGIKLHIIYFSLTDINITTVMILFSIHLPSIHTHESCPDDPLWYLGSPHLVLPRDFTSKLNFKHELTVHFLKFSMSSFPSGQLIVATNNWDLKDIHAIQSKLYFL